MASLEILAVGTELLLGQLLDTNSKYIAALLAESGIDVYAMHTSGDNRERIVAAMRGALDRADGLITTGGLGPTVDDLTKEAVCDALGVDTELDEASLEAMTEHFQRVGRVMRDNNRKQAEVPRGSLVLRNENGTAPGFISFRSDGKFIASMPGVPREMKPMLQEQLLPWLRERFNVRASIFTRILHTINIAESEIDHRIDDLFRALENPKIAVLAHDYRCDVKIMAKAASEREAAHLIQPIERDVFERLRGHVYGFDDETLPSAIHVLLQQNAQTIATAESCTGGSIAAELTSVSGSSKSFVGGIVAYDNGIKREALGVQGATLERFGAVSEETAIEMAQGIRARFNAGFGLATTGIAGPTGGTPEKPVGLVWVALASPHGVHSVRLQFAGERAEVQRRATVAALGFLWRLLRS